MKKQKDALGMRRDNSHSVKTEECLNTGFEINARDYNETFCMKGRR